MAQAVMNISNVPSTPWKNGGGSTKEIAAFPPGAGLNDFIWRVSVAEISQSSAYSVFSGIDRTQVLIAGNGLSLTSQAELNRQLLAFQPFSFVGEQDWFAEPDGVCQMLNVMTSRADVTSELEVVRGYFKYVADGKHYVLAIVQGEYRAEDSSQRFVVGDFVQPQLAIGETLALSASADAVMVVIQFSLLNK